MRKNSRLTLLHVDENTDDRLRLRSALDSTGSFNFVGVNDLQAAVDYVTESRRTNQRRPALVLVDYPLGIQCGTDFLYWLRIQNRNTALPVIFYSGTSLQDQVSQCYTFGGNHFLKKPLTLGRVKVIARALRTCFSRLRPDFGFLDSLPEAIPDPWVAVVAAA